MALTSKLSAIGDAIRDKTGKSGLITLDQMPLEIASISTGPSLFRFGGTNGEQVSHYEETFTLADTSFVVGTSASTSATSILATVANKYTNTTGSPTYAYGDKDIIVVQRVMVEPTHDGSSGKAEQIRYGIMMETMLSKRKTTATSAKTSRQAISVSTYMNEYRNASGVITRAAANYGFYATPQAATISSATSASAYARAGSPILYYRASSTYESTANIKLVTDVTWKWTVDVYVVDPMSAPVAAFNDELDGLLINGI